MQPQVDVPIRAAVWPDDEPATIALLHGYADFLRNNPAGAVNICLSGYQQELATLAERWSDPHGVLLLAIVAGQAAGCVAVKVRHDRPGACEMKRLWVDPAYRGRHLGAALIEACAQWCRERGYSILLLDTVPTAMPAAVALYRRHGFTETERHNSNDVSGLVFFERILR